MTVDEVKQALSCLYDLLELSQVALCQYFPAVQRETERRNRAQAMRSILMDAIEALQPHAVSLPLTPALRGYELLNLHYVQRLSLAEAAEDLAISLRQAYRDFSEALEKITEYLRELAQGQAELSEGATTPALRDELKQLVLQRGEVNIIEVLQAAIEIIEPLAQVKGTTIRNRVQLPLPQVNGDPGLLRHLLVSFLSSAVRHCTGSEVIVETEAERRSAALNIRFTGELSATALISAELMDLCDAQSVKVSVGWDREKTATLSLRLPADSPYLILVIEDNPGVVELYRRMLQETGEYKVISVSEPEKSPSLAECMNPDAIILDILMPGQDGWTVLKSLRNASGTKHIPILVCSVFDESELAMALGATAYLKKPISQQKLVEALQACLQGPD